MDGVIINMPYLTFIRQFPMKDEEFGATVAYIT